MSLWGSALGVFVLLNLWLTDSTDLLGFHFWQVLLFAGPAVALGLALLARPTALTAPRFVVAYFLFLAIAGGGMYFAGPLVGTAISGFFVWGTLALFILLPRRHALALVGVAGAVLALVMGARPGYSVPALRWELTMAACLGPGLLTACSSRSSMSCKRRSRARGSTSNARACCSNRSAGTSPSSSPT